MPFILRLYHRFPVRYSVGVNACPFGKMASTLMSILLLVLAALSGCASNENLGEVRATKPIRIGTFETPYEVLATCTKQRAESNLWLFGEPSIHWIREKDRPLIRVYAIYSRTTLFDVAFEQTQSDRTAVEYRRGYDGYGIQDQTWGIIVSCAQQGRGPIN
jgi:hypothetical protein